tara:strand:+ start:286 stop:456 length:171 start_codon:yes stop_codon:yes gene_type:complete
MGNEAQEVDYESMAWELMDLLDHVEIGQGNPKDRFDIADKYGHTYVPGHLTSARKQ